MKGLSDLGVSKDDSLAVKEIIQPYLALIAEYLDPIKSVITKPTDPEIADWIAPPVNSEHTAPVHSSQTAPPFTMKSSNRDSARERQHRGSD